MSTPPKTTGLRVDILGIGLVGPGMVDWASAAPGLADPALWRPAPTVVPAPQRLAAAERRRASTGVKLSIVAADQACAAANADPAALATVFTSSTADPSNCHALCEALATPDRLVSPTRFTNSVHNAPSGYWHIATHAMRASTSLSAFDASFAAGLLEAAALCLSSGEPVLLVACDVPYPEPLHRLRPLPDSFALALLLGPAAEMTRPIEETHGGVEGVGSVERSFEGYAEKGAATAPATSTETATAKAPPPRLEIRLADAGAAPTLCVHPGLEALRGGIPAARALPLLQALAALQAPAQVDAEMPLASTFAPCPAPATSPRHFFIEGLPGELFHLTLHR